MFVKELHIKLDNYLTKSDLEFTLKPELFKNSCQPFHFDLSCVNFINVNALIFLLEILRYFHRRNLKTELSLPENERTLKYLSDRNFLHYASEYALLRADLKTIDYVRKKETNINSEGMFLNITKIEKSKDIHNIISAVRWKLQKIMKKDLLYDKENVERFLVAISEVCQNVVEHSEDYGFIAVEKYSSSDINENRGVLKIAVSDGGIGIDGSLKKKNLSLTEKLKAVFFDGMSRFDDIGRGHGIPQLRSLTKMWHGSICLRSSFTSLTGIYKKNNVREYLSNRLNEFSGVQVDIELPESILWMQ